MPFFDDADNVYEDFNNYCRDNNIKTGPAILSLIKKELIKVGLRKK